MPERLLQNFTPALNVALHEVLMCYSTLPEWSVFLLKRVFVGLQSLQLSDLTAFIGKVD